MKQERFKIFGQFFIDPVFIALMNGNYFPAQKMRDSVARLVRVFGAEWVKNVKWGDYQGHLVDGAAWPGNARKFWSNSVQFARNDLAAQPNQSPVSRVDPAVPADKCALLDACVRKCFNTALPGETEPGIPMMIDVRLKAFGEPADDRHDIWLSWTYDPTSAKPDDPVQLNLTMVCPSEKAVNARRKTATRSATPKPSAGTPAKKAAKKTAKKTTKKTAKKAARKAGRK